MVKKQNTMYLSYDKMTSISVWIYLFLCQKKMNKRPLKDMESPVICCS